MRLTSHVCQVMEQQGATLALHVALGGAYFSVAKPFAVLDQNSPAALRLAAMTSEDKTRFLEKAVANFDAAVRIDPKHAKALWSKVCAPNQMG
jgi:hypothetical protein